MKDRWRQEIERARPKITNEWKKILKSIAGLKLSEEQKDLAFTYLLSRMLYLTPLPNRSLINILKSIISDIKKQEDRDWLNWKTRKKLV
ncbi:MAG: hypothetical protein AB1393_10295 [Candidatus Edwardsbacteria bacterium]